MDIVQKKNGYPSVCNLHHFSRRIEPISECEAKIFSAPSKIMKYINYDAYIFAGLDFDRHTFKDGTLPCPMTAHPAGCDRRFASSTFNPEKLPFSRCPATSSARAECDAPCRHSSSRSALALSIGVDRVRLRRPGAEQSSREAISIGPFFAGSASRVGACDFRP